MLLEDETNKRHHYTYKIKQIYKSSLKSGYKSKLQLERLSQELTTIPELIEFIGAENNKKTKVIINELSYLLQIKEYKTGFCFHKILSKNENNNLIMILKGSVMELGVKYIKKYLSFKEYILYLTKIYLLNEKLLYFDCIKKNYESFPFKEFMNYLDKDNNQKNNININKIEEEKNSINFNSIDLNDLNDIDIIKIGKGTGIKNFNFIDEMNKIEEKIKNSKWKKFIKKLNFFGHDYDKAIGYFLELYNYDNKNYNNIINDKKYHLLKEVKYYLYIPYFFKKKILSPISFIGDFNYPFRMKNYTTLIALENCLTIFIDKSRLSFNRYLFKYSHDQKLNYIIENIFTKHYIFKYINIDFLNKFGKYFDIIHLKKDDIVFLKGEFNQGVYIINKGSTRITSNQSYLSLINLNYYLLHSTDYCNQYISDIKKKEITSRNHLSGYYHYKGEKNDLMKNPLFAKYSKVKEDINFGDYIEGDLLGLGEMINYRNYINLFTAKVSSDNIELIFIPREIFKALLSNNDINKKCGFLIEKKAMTLKERIEKYKNFFENKIYNSISKDNNSINPNIITQRSRSRYILRNSNNSISKIKDLNKDFIYNSKSVHNKEKSSIISNDINKNNISLKDSINIDKKKNNYFACLEKKIMSMKIFKNKSNVNKHFNRTFLIKDKTLNILNCQSTRCLNKRILKNKNISVHKDILNKSCQDIKILKNIDNKRVIFSKKNKITPNSFIGKKINGIDLDKNKNEIKI